jgi:hypothetical protein
MRAEVELTAGPDDAGPTHYDRDAADGCQCRTCRRRRAMLEPGLVPRVDGVTGRSFSNPDDEPGLPPRHVRTGQFLAERHPVHDGRNVKGEFVEDGVYGD